MTVACGGGGGGGSSVPAHQGAATTNGTAILTIPNRSTSSTARQPQFISASAVSVGVAVNGGAQTFSDISTTSTLCTTTTNGRTCTIPISAPAGGDTFVFTFYDAASGGGKTLGTGVAKQVVVLGTPFTLPVTVDGVAASIAVTVPAIDAGPTSVPVTVVVKDADGNQIIGPGTYSPPITLTNSDTTGTLTLSETTVDGPSDVITLAYSGGALSAAATISASATGVTPTNVLAASVLPLNYFPINLERTYASASNDQTSVDVVNGPAQPTSTPDAFTGSATQSITGGATFAGVTNAQQILQNAYDFMGITGIFGTSTNYAALQSGAYDFIGTSYGPVTTYEPPSCSLGPPYGDTGIQTVSNFTTSYSQGFVDPALPFASTPVSFVAAYTESGTDVYGPPPNSSSLPDVCGSTGTPPTVTHTYTYTQDTSGNYTEVDSYTDGSTYTEHDNVDGSATIAYAAGQTIAGSSWENGLPASDTAATESVAAPSGGSIAIAVSQTSASGTQTSSATLPVAALYPNGVPTALWTGSSSAGAPVTSLPSACAVTATYTGPVVPVTLSFARWEPATQSVLKITLVDYLAPSIGLICELQTYANQTGETPAALAFGTISSTAEYEIGIDNYTEADSLTSIGTPGSVSVSGRPRSAVPSRLRFGLTGPMHGILHP